ncbi:hypothetical protein CYY_005067 [Polysphondylium violaceum]|uniref:Uncharacterized protein n=1 Tax=Polysphondylium violaceum TaxID=133409 RepID=A0A8J4PUV4_9MYCE|nr:hypothetical protein CYY_005067 [Polysphondylium violaceum]
MINANKKIINQIIRNVVQLNSIPDGTMPSPEASFSLNRYFDDPNTVDIVYVNMIDRVKNEKSHYEQVLSRILKLIKNNIALHPPSYQILLELDTFCLTLSSTNALLQKTITYLRALIANQVKNNPHYESIKKLHLSDNRSNKNNSIGLLRNRSHSASNSTGSNRDESIFQRSSLDLSNLLSTSVSSTSSNSSSSSSSSPLSLNDSPLRNTLLGGGAGGASSSQNGNNTNQNSNNNNNHHQHHHHDRNSSGGGGSGGHNQTFSPSLYSSNHQVLPLSASSSETGFKSTDNNNLNSSNGLKDSTSSISSNSPLVSATAYYNDGFIRDLISIKAVSQPSIPKIKSLLINSPYGGIQAEVKGKEAFRCPDDSSNWSSINVVRVTKKKIENKDLAILTFKKKKPTLFQYKYYKDQEALKITDAEINQVIRVIMNPATQQDRSIATKIFIKILLDIYCKNSFVDQATEKLITDYFVQMISNGNRECKIHTFNILFNLSIHINLYSEQRLEDGASSIISSSMINELQDSIFTILLALINHCIITREREEKVWSESLNCLMFFITEQGNIIKDRLYQLNPQIITVFLLNIQDLSDYTKRVLVRMLVNFLYKDQILNQQNNLFLNQDELNQIGGIDIILKLYTTIRSNEAKNNLFVIIFDYVLQTALKIQNIVDTQLTRESPLLLELFRRADAPQYFTQIFKCIPEKDFVSDFFLFFSNEHSKDEASFSYEDLIIKFSMRINEFAQRYQKVDQNFENYILDCQDNPEQCVELLNDWIKQNDDLYLFNAENWLFSLLKKVYVEKEGLNNPLYSFSSNIFVQLPTNSSPKVRKMYISLTERLILLLKYKLKYGESKPNDLFEMFNESFHRLLLVFGEKSENNILHVVDILFDLISGRSNSSSLRSKESKLDTNFSLFLSNQLVVSISSLKSININIIHYLFSNITESNNTREQRLFLLHLLIQRSHDSDDLLKIGGIVFFKNLLSDLNTQIAYHSSYFLLTQLEAESPEQYRTILTRLLTKARENNDENLISNPFFQVQGIIEMTHKS